MPVTQDHDAMVPSPPKSSSKQEPQNHLRSDQEVSLEKYSGASTDPTGNNAGELTAASNREQNEQIFVEPSQLNQVSF